MISLPILFVKVVAVVFGITLITIGVWMCITVAPNLFAVIYEGVESILKGIKGGAQVSGSSWFGAFTGLFVIFVIGIVLITLGIIIIIFKLKRA